MPTPIIERPAKYWFADDYKGSTIDPNVGVIHTTEGTSLPWYGGGASAPTYTAVPDLTKKRLTWIQHFPDTMSARALRNESGGVETNTLNCIQLELVGTCDPETSKKWTAAKRQHIFWPEAPAWALDEVAEFVALKHRQHGIRVEGPEQIGKTWRAYPASYGTKAGQRFSGEQWREFYGWCGHQHVPENSHGDPGNLPWSYIEKQAKAILNTPPKGNPVTNTNDTYYAHVHAKTAAEQAEAITSRLSLEVPEREPVTGTGDAYYAHYWAKRAASLLPAVDAELGRLGYPK